MPKPLLIAMAILKDSEVVEGPYRVPDHSWIQTETLGAQHVPAVTQETDYKHPRGYTIRFVPVGYIPHVPVQMAKLLDSRDPKWGRNGWQWMGSHRERAGGTTLDRAREACQGLRWMRDFPLRDDPDVRQFCETELGEREGSPSPVHFVVEE